MFTDGLYLCIMSAVWTYGQGRGKPISLKMLLIDSRQETDDISAQIVKYIDIQRRHWRQCTVNKNSCKKILQPEVFILMAAHYIKQPGVH